MVQKILNALASNIQEKSKSPFIGSFFLVTIYNEWHTILKSSARVDFNESEKIDAFIKEMKSVLDQDLWLYAFYSILSVIAYYGINFLVKSINAFFDQRLWPWTLEKISSKTVVTKEKYESLKREKEALEEDVDRLTDRLAKVSHADKEKAPTISSKQEELDVQVSEIMDKLFDEDFTKYDYLNLIDEIKSKPSRDMEDDLLQKITELQSLKLIKTVVKNDIHQSINYHLTPLGQNICTIVKTQLKITPIV